MDNIKAVAQAYLDMLEARNKKKLDDVDPKELEGSHADREDGDIDNDGDEDKSDKYLHNRRKSIKKAMDDDDKKGMEEAVQEPKSEDLPKKVKLKGFGPDGAKGNMNNPAARAALRVKEAADLDSDNVEKALKHDCATHVHHESYGYGKCIKGEHTLVQIDEETGYVTHYDVMFAEGRVNDVPVEELDIIAEMSHGHKAKKKMKESLRTKMSEGVEIIARYEDGTVDAFVGEELHRGITEEMAKELKHKNVAKAQPEGQEKLEPRAKGEKDFVDQHKVEKKDEEQTVGVDTKGMDGGVKKAPARTGDKTQSEPMQSVQKTTGQ